MAGASQQLARRRAARDALSTQASPDGLASQNPEPDEATGGQPKDSQVSTSLSDVVGSTSRANSPEKFPEVATSERDNSGRSTPAAIQEDFVDSSDLSVLADMLDEASNYEEGSMSPARVRALDKLRRRLPDLMRLLDFYNTQEEDRSPSSNAQKRKLGQIEDQLDQGANEAKMRRIEGENQALKDEVKKLKDTMRQVRQSNENFWDEASMVDEALRPKLTLAITLGQQVTQFKLPTTALRKPYITYTRTGRVDKDNPE
ncbi:hypothetical protein IWZ01DRAFT_38893 [Phyllosticta capitalensis]